MRFRRRRDRLEAELSLRPISNWMLLLAVVAVAVAGGGLTWWLLSIATADPNASASVQIDAIRTGLSAAVGTGGAFALLLAFRRQRSTEVSAVHTITDATERRVTELYTKAADQLGSDKAPVRLAGLYALERLAQDNPSQRQSIVNVICAYLQMPYNPPGAAPVEPSADDGRSSEDGAAGEYEKRADRERERYEKRLQEHEKRAQEHRVRTAAQRILYEHMSKTGMENLRWLTTVDLSAANLTGASLWRANLNKAGLGEANLTGAYLEQADLINADLREANLTKATLSRANLTDAFLVGANLTGASLKEANLTEAFLSEANLTGTDLGGANLTGAKLTWAYWTDDTTWPPELQDEIRAASSEVEVNGTVVLRIRWKYQPGMPHGSEPA